MSERDYTEYQRQVIRRYYATTPQRLRHRLADLVGKLFLLHGKQQDRLWQSAEEAMRQLGVPASRIEHLLRQRDPALLARLVQELDKD